MAVFSFREAIFKAKIRPPTKMESLSDKATGQVSASIYSGIRTFKKKLSPEKLAEAWETGSFSKVVREIQWKEGVEELVPSFEKLSKHYDSSALISFESLPAPVQLNLRQDFSNPNYKRFITDRFNTFLGDLDKESAKIVQREVQRAFTNAQTPRDVARRIINHIGLNDRQSTALSNYQFSLEQKGMSSERIDALVDRYGNTLLKQRAAMIAKTEIQNINNQGQLSVWQAAQDEGLFDATKTYKIWSADRNPCPVCKQMNGKKVLLNAKWVLPDGRTVNVPSEVHPFCQCMQTLEF